jgi:LCP family protein required for cell wall assembly
MGYGSRRDDPSDWDRGMEQTAQVRGHDEWGRTAPVRGSGPRDRTGQVRGDAWDQAAPARGRGPARPGGRSPAAASRRTAGPQGARRSQGGGRGTGRGRGTGKIRGSRWARYRAKSWLAQIGYVFVVLSAAFVVAIGITGYAIYQHLDANITGVKVGGLTGRTVYGELNILVLGSQERAGQHGYFGYEADPETENSDNLLLVHLDATHTHATVLSIPRDLYTYEPGCQARPQTGTGIWGPYDYPPGALIDGALNIGGPTCAVETVEALTGIKLDHVIVFDFNSFRTMVDALGGVDVCVPPGPGYHDGYSHLNLSPGIHKVTYNEALAYVRTRHGVGSGADAGGDLPRIELQQAFISSVVQQVEHENLLSDWTSLLHVADIATKALTVDDGLKSVSALLTLAKSLVHLKSKNMNLITLPTTMDTFDYPNPQYADHLMAVQPQDDLLYQMVRTGQTWHGHLPVESYNRVKVYVENGTGQEGLAARTKTELEALGFDVTGIGDTTATSATTVNFAGEDQAEAAYTLMTALKVSNSSNFPAGDNTLNEPASQVGTPGPVTLILGSDFTGVDKPAPATKPARSKNKGSHPKPTASSTPAVSQSIQDGAGAVQSRNAAASICSGLPPAYTPGAQGPG